MQIVSATVLSLVLTFGGASLALAQSSTQPAPQPQLQSDGTVAQPQQAGPMHAKNPAHEAKHLAKALGLTPDQSAQIQPILADRDTHIAALHADTTLDPKTIHKQTRAIHQDTEAKINAILTPSQQQLFADMRTAHKNHGAPPTTNPTA